MSDWDASSGEDEVKPRAPIAAKKSKFADEDASDEDTKDSWDASDSDEEKKAAPKPTGPPPPVRQKGITKQKIAEKEAAERARLDEIASRRDDDPAARKAREKAAQLKSDLDNAAALLGNTGVSDDPLAMRCSTKEDFDTLSTLLSAQIIAKHGNHPLYAMFINQFVVDLAAPLKDVECRKAASGLTTLSNAKQAEAKAGKGKKGGAKGKPALGASKNVGAGRADMGTYEEILDDGGEYDDFM